MTTVILLPFQLWRALCSCMLSGAALPLCPATPPSVNACRIRTMPSSMLAVLERALWSDPHLMTYSDLSRVSIPSPGTYCYFVYGSLSMVQVISVFQLRMAWQVSFHWFAGCPSSVLQGRVSTFTQNGNETVRNAWNTLKQWWNLWLLTSHAVSCNSSDACNNGPALVYLIYSRIDVHTSRAGQAGGGSIKEKNYKSKKAFA